MRSRVVLSGARLAIAGVTSLVLLQACSDQLPTDVPDSINLAKGGRGPDPTVERVDPAEAPQNTTLDVHVRGQNFDEGSKVRFLLNGKPTKNIATNSTQFVNEGDLKANITIALDAATVDYDIEVTTSKKRRGIGTELFSVKSGKGNKTKGVYVVTITTDPNLVGDVITGLGGTSAAEGPATVDITNTNLALWGDHGVDFTIPITKALFDCFNDPRAAEVDIDDVTHYTIHRRRGALTIIAENSTSEAEVTFGIHVKDAKGLWIPYQFQTFGDIVGDFLPATVGSFITVTGTDEAWTLENSEGKKGRACAADSGTVSFQITVTLDRIIE